MAHKVHLSASAIGTFKSCPMRYRNAYYYGIRPIVATEALRIGTNWHDIQEINRQAPDNMDAIIAELNRVYDEIPVSMDRDKLEVERIILLYSLIGYNWLYQNNDEEVLATEIEFELPVVNPETGRALPNVINRGKIDKLIRINGMVYVKEHKSTSSSVAPDSSLWGHLTLDTQINNYVYAARILGLQGKLAKYGIGATDRIAGVYFDVWHKPGIKPKKLSQADSKVFIETGKYCGQKFSIGGQLNEGSRLYIMVSDIKAELTPGKKEGALAVSETPEMYGARLLQDIMERPEFYFACRELPKTESDTTRFEHELYNVYKTIREMIKTGHWYCDESQCEATFKCSYIEQCYNNTLIDRDHIPEDMECIFDKEKK